MCNTIIQQYFKYVYDVTSVTMETTECLEKDSPISSFC